MRTMNEIAALSDAAEGPAAAEPDRHKQLEGFVMTESKKSQPTSPDELAKTSPKASVELSEKQLEDASGGAIYMNQQNPGAFKFNNSVKLDTDPALLLPAVKPGQ